MALDRWIAVFFLVFSILYGYASYTYPLLPFERNMSFLPNTMPMALSILGVIIATVLLVVPKAEQPNGDMPAAEIDVSRLKDYKLGQAIAMIAAMLAYALLLRPLGFIPATIFFLVGCSWILGERRYSLMVSVAVIGTLSIWYLVQEVLGVYLKPLPALLS